MELKPNMYVRTKNGEIGKITSCYLRNETIGQWCFNLDIESWETFECDNYCIVGEPSFNIIDLIEEGDYVNGYKVDFVQDGYVVFNHNHPYQINIYPKDIKSIVTKEMFSSVEYKVGE